MGRSLAGRFLAGALAAVVLGLAAAPGGALAHGERATEPFVRTRTAHWYDVKWSTEKVAVGEKVTVSGKFRLFDDWPDATKKPDLVFLSNATAGAVMARIESYINGVPARQSHRSLQLGGDYEFKLVMMGRIPGRWHLHPMLMIAGSGPLVGPGAFVDVSGSAADFVLPATAMTGEQIENLETWGVARVQIWHGILVAIAVAWLLWWLRRPLLVPRHAALQADREDLLITPADVKAGVGLLFLVLVLVIGGYWWTVRQYPQLVPLQAGSRYTPPLPQPAASAKVKVQRAEYDVPGRSMRLTMEVTNVGKAPLRLGEFATANLRFVNQKLPAAVAAVDPAYPKVLVPPSGLAVADDTPIAPGETRALRIDATDAAWELERLTSFVNDVDSIVGGLLFFYDAEGRRHIVNVSGPILPKFTQKQPKGV